MLVLETSDTRLSINETSTYVLAYFSSSARVRYTDLYVSLERLHVRYVFVCFLRVFFLLSHLQTVLVCRIGLNKRLP